MNKPPIPPLRLAALALGSCALAALAVHAQQSPATPTRSLPTVAAVNPAATPAVTVVPGHAAENEPSPPVDTPPATAETTETEILADDGATFASKDRIAVFSGHVRVTDPRFQLACDKLTVFLAKTATTDAMGTATPTPATTPPALAKGSAPAPAPTPGSSGGIDHAIAEGHVIIVQERAATPGGEAKRSVGHADWANFDNKTGDMVLKGTPRVEQNENTHTATSPNTIMTLRRDNSLTTVGPSRTIITQRKGTEMPGSTPVAKPGQPVPAPGGKRTRSASPASTPGAAGVRG